MPARSGAEARRVQPASTRLSSSLADEPAPGGARAAAFRVTPDPRAVAPARHFLKSTLASWGVDEDAIAAAILCLSELITNAIIHARTGCEVRAVLDRGVLTTTVRDRGSAVVGPRGQTEDSLAVHGRGLRLVDTLATRWGCQLDAIGTTAWFVLEPTLQTNN